MFLNGSSCKVSILNRIHSNRDSKRLKSTIRCSDHMSYPANGNLFSPEHLKQKRRNFFSNSISIS